MMMICAEAEQRFVWLDPRGKQLSAREQVLLVFSQIERWEEMLADNPSDCVHALRTKCEPIAPGDAVRLARRRMRELQRRRRSRAAPSRAPLRQRHLTHCETTHGPVGIRGRPQTDHKRTTKQG